MRIQTTREDHRIAWLTALAVTLHWLEGSFLSPLKPGLANVITIVVLVRFGWSTAAWVSGLRVIVGSLLLGTLFSPTFMLSLSGAMASIASLWVLHQLQGCGPVGYSVVAAMAHMLGQFWVAYGLFVQHTGLFHLLPVLMSVALGFGLITGLFAAVLLERAFIPPKVHCSHG